MTFFSLMSRDIPLSFIVKRSHRRERLALTVGSDGVVRVAAPYASHPEEIRHFVERSAAWIKRQQERFNEWRRAAGASSSVALEWWYLGERYPIIYQNTLMTPRFKNGWHIAAIQAWRTEELLKKWFMSSAEQYIAARVEVFAVRGDFTYSGIKITQAATRWGSCSPAGALNFSWRLLMTPPHVIDYVVVHELAHLRHHNHSRHFWSEVARWCPNYAKANEWLKTVAHVLPKDFSALKHQLP